MINSYAGFTAYFRTLIAGIPDIKQFVVGGAERILNRNRSTINYPIFWLEIPDVSITRGGSTGDYSATFSSAFIILRNAQTDDWSREDQDLDLCLQLVYRVLVAMKNSADEDNEFTFDLNNVSVEHKGKWGDDNDWGWRVGFSLTMPINECL